MDQATVSCKVPGDQQIPVHLFHPNHDFKHLIIIQVSYCFGIKA